MHAVTMPVYVALRCRVSGARMALTHCVMNQCLLLGPDNVRQYLYCLVRVTYVE